jgi:cytochrome P450
MAAMRRLWVIPPLLCIGGALFMAIRRRSAVDLPPVLPLSGWSVLQKLSGPNWPFWLMNLQRSSGVTAFRLHLPFGKELYIVTDPEIALGILRDRTNDKPPHIKNTTIMSGGRLSIFSSPMHLNHWKVNRKCVAPAFAKSALAGKMTLLETKLAVFDALLAEHASSRTPADINELLINLTVNFIALSAFGYDLQTTPSTKGGPPSEGEQFLFHLRVVLREAFLKRLMNPLRKYMFWNAEVRQAERSSQWLLTFAIEIIRHYRDTHTERDIEADDSIIAHLLRNKQYPDDTSRAADVIIFLIGGHDTTSYTMAWLLYELAKNPDLQERLHLELLEAAKTGPLTPERLAQLPFFNRCLRESMGQETCRILAN